MLLTLAFVLIFLAGLAAGFTLRMVLDRHAYEHMTETVIDAATRPPCLVEGCGCRDTYQPHLH